MTTLLSRAALIDRFALTPESSAELGLPMDQDECDHIVRRLRLVQIAGARHGKAGYYPDGDYSSDADWCYGTGSEIDALEAALDIDDGSVMDLYTDAHAAFYRDGTINPDARHDGGSVFTFRFGAYGDTVVHVWAQAGHIEDALEMAAEWLADHAPGIFVEPDYADAARDVGVSVPFEGSDLATLYANGEDELAERIHNRAECDLTYTESGWLASWEWTVDESDTPPGHDPSHAGPRHYGPARHADGTRK